MAKFYLGQKAAEYLTELNALHTSVQNAIQGPTVAMCTATSSPGIVGGQSLKVSMSGTSLLAGGSIASFKLKSWAGTQIVPAVSNSATALITATGTVGSVLQYTVTAIDNFGNESHPVTNSVNVVTNHAPTGTIVVNAPTEVTSASAGNQISFTGLVDNDGTGFTYTIINDSVGMSYTFSKLTGIADGEVVTFSAPNLGSNGIDTNIIFHVKGVDSLGAETAVMAVSIKTIISHVIGVVLKTTGGGGGTWGQIDIDGNDIAAQPKTYFDGNPPWQLTDVTIDGQAMIKCPKFYYKTGVISGGVNNGLTGWWVSDLPRTGFTIHPAFRKAGADIDQFYIGKYMASYDSASTKMQSIVTTSYWNNITFSTAKNAAAARNTAGVTGFEVMDIWKAMAICWLYLIENRTMSSSKPYNYRGIMDVCPDMSVGTVGSYILDGCYQSGGNTGFWDLNGNKTYSFFTGSYGSLLNGYGMTFKTGSPWNAGFFAATTNGSGGTSSTATVPDLQYGTDGGLMVYGSGTQNSADNGMFCFVNRGDGQAGYTSIGARLAKT